MPTKSDYCMPADNKAACQSFACAYWGVLRPIESGIFLTGYMTLLRTVSGEQLESINITGMPGTFLFIFPLCFQLLLLLSIFATNHKIKSRIDNNLFIILSLSTHAYVFIAATLYNYSADYKTWGIISTLIIITFTISLFRMIKKKL